MMVEEEKHFWHSQDLASGKALELGVPPEDIQMEEVGKRVTWGPAIEPVPEGPPLVPLGEVPVGRDWRCSSGRRWCCSG